MSELEHALRSALADPPGARPRDTDALYDIELRLTRRRQRRRRTKFGALAVAAVAAIAIPIGVAGPHSSSDTSANSGSKAATDAGGGRGAESAAAAPAAVRAAAQRAADAPGEHVSDPVRWVRTRSSKVWALQPPNHGIKPADRAIYVIALTGRFRCLDCHEAAGPGHYSPQIVDSELIIVPVSPRPGDRAPTAIQGQNYDLAKLGDVHTFTLR